MIFSIHCTNGIYHCIPKSRINHSFSLKDQCLMFGNNQLTILYRQQPLNLITYFSEMPTLKQLAMMALQKQYGITGGLTDEEM